VLVLLSPSNIRVDSQCIYGTRVLNQTASHDEARLQVPNRQVVLSVDSDRYQVGAAVGKGECLYTSLMESVPLNQLS